MGQAAPNVGTGTHVYVGNLQGYFCHVHQGNIDLYTQSPDVPWATYRGILIAARDGTPAELDAAAIAAWGNWWPEQILSRNLRGAARLALSNYLPPHIPIPA